MKPPDLAARQRATRDFETNVVVTAGAGTGKTSLLVERVLRAVIVHGVPLERLVAITFTRKAAAEMRERLEDALERASSLLSADACLATDPTQEADRALEGAEESLAREVLLDRARAAAADLESATISTIHSFCLEILRRHHNVAGLDSALEIDEDGSAAADLFDELWSEFIEVDGSRPERAASWAKLLERLPLEVIEGVARKLSGFAHPFERIAAESRETQLACCAEIATDLEESLEFIRTAVIANGGLDKKGTTRLTKHVSAVESLLDGLRSSTLTQSLIDASKLGKKECTVGKNHCLDPATHSRADAELTRQIKTLRAAATCNVDLSADLVAVVLPFVEHFRGRFLASGKISNDALISLARDLLRDHASVRQQEAGRLDQLLLDEFQDTDPAQYEIAFFLAGASGSERERDAFRLDLVPGKLFIVGDAKQSIYGFRGADIVSYQRSVETLRKQGGVVLELTCNFRSTPDVIDPINRVFAAWFGSASGTLPDAASLDPNYAPLTTLRPHRDRDAVEVWSVGTSADSADVRRLTEGRAIAEWIEGAVSDGRHRLSDIAILLRATTEVDQYTRALRDRGLPWILASGKGFYQRYEVELLLALLRLVVDPDDSVSLILCLRSQLGGVPDRQLQEHAAMSAAEGRWTLTTRIDSETCPELARAIGLLRDFRERHRDDPLDLVARAALVETPLRCAMAASHDGAQRIANLDKAIRNIAELIHGDSLDPTAALDRLELERARDVESGDSPLADEAVDAVTILSIHRSKGLEWPVVIVPDLANTQPASGSREGTLAWLARNDRSALALHLTGTGHKEAVKTPALLLHQEQERRNREAERKRLLYVAMTRAAETLILVVGGWKNRAPPWVAPLSACGYAVDGTFPETATSAIEGVVHRRLRPAEETRPARDSTVDNAAALLAAAHRHEAARRSLGAAVPPAEKRPRDAAHRSLAVAVGSAVHHLLELWDRETIAWLHEHAEVAARIAAEEAGVEPTRVFESLRSRLTAAERSGRLAELRELPVLARELPILQRSTEGKVLRSVVDLVSEAEGRPLVVDYKTDQATSAATLEERYAEQLDRYAEGLRRGLSLDEAPAVRLFSLGSTDGPLSD